MQLRRQMKEKFKDTKEKSETANLNTHNTMIKPIQTIFPVKGISRKNVCDSKRYIKMVICFDNKIVLYALNVCDNALHPSHANKVI